MSRTVDTMEMEAEKEARQTLFDLSIIRNTTPDSLRTPEQKALLKKLEKLEEIFYERCEIKGKRLEVSISKEDFRTVGMPEIYYDILKKDLKDINRYIDTSTVVPAEMIIDAYKKSRDEYFARNKKN
ncbi:MAG: hypothetical protein LBU37_05190 [Tannerellaceae bacterium]|jgi:hypothetical protein|nr:hypothetical protein [Tannerellaceae bacterium]